MAPLGFEKKTFYPSPLSSLNRLTLNLMTPKGININNHPDVLKVKTINLVNLTAKTADTTSVAAAATQSGAADYTLKTNVENGVFRNLGLSDQITLTSTGNISAVNFTITGTDNSGTVLSEIIAGPNNNTVTSVNFYSTVTKLSCDAAVGTNTSAGHAGNVNVAISASKGFPYDNSNLCIQITVFSYFSNRVFKIGDNIKIKGFNDESSDTYDITSFINRDEGHYILNLEKEITSTENTVNEGFINTLYISPPGEIDFTKENGADIVINETSKNAAVEIYSDTDSSNTTKDCKLINQSLQSNYVFKVITREDDITNVMNPSNI